LVRELQDEQRQDLAFHSQQFVLCGLPIRRPEAGTLSGDTRRPAENQKDSVPVGGAKF